MSAKDGQDRIKAAIEAAFTNPFRETEMPDLNDLPEVVVLWQQRRSSWPIPQVDASIDVRETVLRVGGGFYLWRRAWWNKKVLAESITSLPHELVTALALQRESSAKEEAPPRAEIEQLFVGGFIDSLRRDLATVEHRARKSLDDDLGEVAACLRVGAYRAVLALIGRSLEIVLKMGLDGRQIEYGPEWMVGRLLREYQDRGVYLDPTLKNSYNLLNLHRVQAVHFKEIDQVPTKEQALAAVLTLVDTVRRCLLSEQNQISKRGDS